MADTFLEVTPERSPSATLLLSFIFHYNICLGGKENPSGQMWYFEKGKGLDLGAGHPLT